MKRTLAVVAMAVLAMVAILPLTLAAGDEEFVRDIQPILSQRCYGCHAGVKTMGGIRFDRKASAFGKADSGLVPILPGNPEGSELLRRVKSTEPGRRMPLGQRALSEPEIAVLEKWIREGAQNN